MKKGQAFAGLELDRLVHEKARLMILTYLASSAEAETGFTELRDALSMSAGNLSIQLKTLEEAGYLSTSKRFQNNKPFTGIRLTSVGQDALERYLNVMEQLVAAIRQPAPGGNE